jgi:hypothetical protein
MKPAIIFLIFVLFTWSCKPKNGETADQHLRQENFDLRKENDSLKALIEKSERSYEGDTIQKLPEPSTQSSYPTFPGKHDLTIQWISWEKPGSVTITPADSGWYTIKGSQNGEQGSYLRIDGRIKPLNDRELEFVGNIEHNVHNISPDQPCIRTGKQLFKATGTRKYWRLQNMISCDGTTTDYVDIYF